MNEAAKAYIAKRINDTAPQDRTGFDWGTLVGKEAATAAIQFFLYDKPEDVAPRPEWDASRALPPGSDA